MILMVWSGRDRKYFVELYDVRMPEGFEDLDFSCDSFDIGNIEDLAFLKNLDGDLFASEDMSGELDFAEGALAECFAWWRGKTSVSCPEGAMGSVPKR